MQARMKEAVSAYYDVHMFSPNRQYTFIEKIGFFNMGYWKGVSDSVEIAQINLIETLIAFFTKRDGRVLDVACGKGASTRYLTKYFEPSNVTGINISEQQLQICRLITPECDFKLMDAAQLEFGDEYFDNLLCIEAAHHFLTRERFLNEAYRVLKPDGRLAMSDILFDYDILERSIRNTGKSPDPIDDISIEVYPRENYLPNIDAYKDKLLNIGFRYVRIEDSTEHSVDAIAEYEIRKLERDSEHDHNRTNIDRAMALQSKISPMGCFAGCMVYAIK